MSLSYAAVCKNANDGKFDGKNLNEEHRRMKDRFNKVLNDIGAAILEIEKSQNPLIAYNVPFEVRLLILNFAIDPITTPFFLKGHTGKSKQTTCLPLGPLTTHPSLRMRLEALLITIEKTTIEIHSGPANQAVQAWLASIDFTRLRGDSSYRSGFDVVKALRFPFFSRFPHRSLPSSAKNEDIQLIRCCKNLSSVRLTFVDEELTYFYNMDGWLAKPVEQIREEYRLDDILGCGKLKHLHLANKITYQVYEASGHVGERVVGRLREWLEGAFRGRGMEVVVTVSSHSF